MYGFNGWGIHFLIDNIKGSIGFTIKPVEPFIL